MITCSKYVYWGIKAWKNFHDQKPQMIVEASKKYKNTNITYIGKKSVAKNDKWEMAS
jgi:hypothetical protein